MHQSMKISNLFHLVMYVKNNLDKGQKTWLDICKELGGNYIINTNNYGYQTIEDIFEDGNVNVWTITYLLKNSLEKQLSNHVFKHLTYILVYTKNLVLQRAHVDMGGSIFIPGKILGWIIYLLNNEEDMDLDICPLYGLHHGATSK